jgi:hypothetical protein
MDNTNKYVLGEIIRSLFHVAGRRTTYGFAAKVIGSIIKNLQPTYDFLKYVNIIESGNLNEDEAVEVSPEIDSIDKELIGKAIESIIRIVYMDIIGKAGLFFIAEIKRRAGEDLITNLHYYGVDLASLQVEQHYLHRSRERKKRKVKTAGDSGVSLLGYTWKNVASWKYDTGQETCVLYNKEGEVLDNLHLDSIIENYVKTLSSDLEEIPDELETGFQINDKELQLLEMLYSKDMDSESAMSLLHVNKTEFNTIVKRLLKNELLQYTSFNVIELTERGLSIISKKNKDEQNKENMVKSA